MDTKDLALQFEALFTDMPPDAEADKQDEDAWLEEAVSSLYSGEAMIEALLAAPVTVETMPEWGNDPYTADRAWSRIVPVVVVIIVVALTSISLAVLLTSFSASVF